mgnify:FL=1
MLSAELCCEEHGIGVKAHTGFACIREPGPGPLAGGIHSRFSRLASGRPGGPDGQSLDSKGVRMRRAAVYNRDWQEHRNTLIDMMSTSYNLSVI